MKSFTCNRSKSGNSKIFEIFKSNIIAIPISISIAILNWALLLRLTNGQSSEDHMMYKSLCDMNHDVNKVFPYYADCRQYVRCLKNDAISYEMCNDNFIWSAADKECREADDTCENLDVPLARTNLLRAYYSNDFNYYGDVCWQNENNEMKFPAKNCTRYIKCAAHNIELHFCPEHQSWDDKLKRCVSSDLGTCDMVASRTNILIDATALCKIAPTHSKFPGTACNNYVVCTNDHKAVLKECTENGTIWNNELKECNILNQTSCRQIQVESEIIKLIEMQEMFNELCKLVPNNTIYSNPDCTGYVICSDRDIVYKICDENTVWNSAAKVCTKVAQKESFKCEHFNPETELSIQRSIVGHTTQQYLILCQITPFEMLFPNLNCTGFVKCANKTHVEYVKCKPGMIWNPLYKECDTPDKALCKTFNPEAAVQEAKMKSNQMNFSMIIDLNADEQEFYKVLCKHSPHNTKYSTKYCSYYVRCFYNVPILEKCLHFGHIYHGGYRTCTEAHKVACDPLAVYREFRLRNYSLAMEYELKEEANFYEYVCSNSPKEIKYRHLFDCQKYVVCYNTTYDVNTCGASSVWDQDIQQCDESEYAKCRLMPVHMEWDQLRIGHEKLSAKQSIESILGYNCFDEE